MGILYANKVAIGIYVKNSHDWNVSGSQETEKDKVVKGILYANKVAIGINVKISHDWNVGLWLISKLAHQSKKPIKIFDF